MNRDRLRRALALLRNPAGLRAQLLSEFRYLLTPLACFAASAYRRWWVAECRVIVVFGSFGKTTTAHFAAHALACVGSGRVAVNTLTPVALAVLRLRRDSRTAVFEVGIGDRGQMAKFARMLRPDIAVATSIGSEHQ
jgi:UDP-N-acetylmuramyl pentapeptide synthase